MTEARRKVGIAIPVANEEESIEAFLKGLVTTVTPLAYDFIIYVVMDAFSRDNTQALVEALARQDGRLRLVYYGESTGVASCYLEGFRQALVDGCDFIIEMDSGGSHPPAKIGEMVAALDGEGHDVVFMSRFLPGGGIRNFPAYRRLVSRGGTWLANLFLGMRLSDATSGFEAFRAGVLRSMDLKAFISRGGIYQTEMKYYCAWQGYKIKEMPFTYVGASTSFKPKWLWIALKTLAQLKQNRGRVLACQATGNR